MWTDIKKWGERQAGKIQQKNYLKEFVTENPDSKGEKKDNCPLKKIRIRLYK